MLCHMTVQPIRAWVPSDTFANRLILVRRELGLSVKRAAGKSDVHYATWSTWENGRTPADMADAVRKISAALGVSREWLMWGGPFGQPTTPDDPSRPSATNGYPRFPHAGQHSRIPSVVRQPAAA